MKHDLGNRDYETFYEFGLLMLYSPLKKKHLRANHVTL